MKVNKSLIGLSSSKIQYFGFVESKMLWNDVEFTQKFYVFKNITAALLGKPAVEDLKMLTINKLDAVSICTAVYCCHEYTKCIRYKNKHFCQRFPYGFTRSRENKRGPRACRVTG